MVMQRTHARAYETPLMDFLELDLEEMREVIRGLKRAAHKVRWREAHTQRAGKVSGVLRGLATLLDDKYAGRNRCDEGWELRAHDGQQVVVAMILVVPKLTSWEGFAAPIGVRVLRPDLIKMEAIKRWQRRRNEMRRRQQKTQRKPPMATSSP
jgi:hypothetical protein